MRTSRRCARRRVVGAEWGVNPGMKGAELRGQRSFCGGSALTGERRHGARIDPHEYCTSGLAPVSTFRARSAQAHNVETGAHHHWGQASNRTTVGQGPTVRAVGVVGPGRQPRVADRSCKPRHMRRVTELLWSVGFRPGPSAFVSGPAPRHQGRRCKAQASNRTTRGRPFQTPHDSEEPVLVPRLSSSKTGILCREARHAAPSPHLQDHLAEVP